MSDAHVQSSIDVGNLPSGGDLLFALGNGYGSDGSHVLSGQCIMQDGCSCCVPYKPSCPSLSLSVRLSCP